MTKFKRSIYCSRVCSARRIQLIPKWFDKTCVVCGKEYKTRMSPSMVKKGAGKYCSKKCLYIGRDNRGEKSSNWKGGRSIHDSGYILLKSPGHPHATYLGYVREHRLVMEKHLVRYLLPSEDVHHLNGIKTDNRIENLELVGSRSEHLRIEHELGTYKDHLYKLNHR